MDEDFSFILSVSKPCSGTTDCRSDNCIDSTCTGNQSWDWSGSAWVPNPGTACSNACTSSTPLGSPPGTPSPTITPCECIPEWRTENSDCEGSCSEGEPCVVTTVTCQNEYGIPALSEGLGALSVACVCGG